MDRYYKEIEGKKVFYKKGMPVTYNGMTYINPKEEHILAAGWLKYEEPIPTPKEKTLEEAIADKVSQILNYDSSSYVNRCYIKTKNDTYEYWADKATRSSLKIAVETYANAGNTNYTLDLRDKGVSMSINCNLLIGMIDALEVYAIECYNVTSQHMFAVKALTNVADVENYDFKTNYPEIITFNINEQ